MNIRKLKSKGSMTGFILFFTFGLLVVILAAAILKYSSLNTMSQGIQDDLLLSNSSAYKYIDREELGRNDILIIKTPDQALNEVKKHLRVNMNLDSNFMPNPDGLILSQVTIKDFVIYNYNKTTVEILTYQNGYFSSVTRDNKEDIRTVNGYPVKSTVITTTISFKVDTFMGEQKDVEVSVDTDVVKGSD